MSRVLETVRAYAAGEFEKQLPGCNVSIQAGVFYSYEMPLAFRAGEHIIMRPREDCPSHTTSRHWGLLRREAPNIIVREDWSMKGTEE